MTFRAPEVVGQNPDSRFWLKQNICHINLPCPAFPVNTAVPVGFSKVFNFNVLTTCQVSDGPGQISIKLKLFQYQFLY